MKPARLVRWVLAILVLASTGLVHAAERSDAKVLAAFRDVVAQPAKSTVQVYCDGYRAALGAIVAADGYVVTKASELKGKIECQLFDGRKLEATIVGADRDLDLAVLKVDAKDLPVIAWSEGDPPAVGSWLATPGIQRDPVAIGVLSVSPRKIPAARGYLGIELPERDNTAQVRLVKRGSPAEKAGVKSGDLILKVNGKEIADKETLFKSIGSYRPGETVELVIKRGEDELNLTATLGTFGEIFEMDQPDRADFQNRLGGQLSERRAGFSSVIQHDSILKPAECGGPVVDLDGKAVGLNIARAGRVESYALPGAVVREAVKKLLETHPVSAPTEAKP